MQHKIVLFKFCHSTVLETSSRLKGFSFQYQEDFSFQYRLKLRDVIRSQIIFFLKIIIRCRRIAKIDNFLISSMLWSYVNTSQSFKDLKDHRILQFLQQLHNTIWKLSRGFTRFKQTKQVSIYWYQFALVLYECDLIPLKS